MQKENYRNFVREGQRRQQIILKIEDEILGNFILSKKEKKLY